MNTAKQIEEALRHLLEARKQDRLEREKKIDLTKLSHDEAIAADKSHDERKEDKLV